MAIHGKTRAKALAAIPNGEEFTAGARTFGVHNFRGVESPQLPGAGSLNEVERTTLHADYLVSGIDYVIWSYQTPIAWHLPTGEWHVVDQKFSVSTSNHQSLVRFALSGANVRSMG